MPTALNPQYALSEEQMRKLNEFNQRRRAQREAHESLTGMGERVANERQSMNLKVLRALKLDPDDLYQSLKEATAKERAKIVDFDNMPTDEWIQWVSEPRSVVDRSPKAPEPIPLPDNSFWWVQTNTHETRGIRAAIVNDVVQFSGEAAYDGNRRIVFSVGATADFAMHPSRLAPSTLGRWRSEPIIDLRGFAFAFTGLQFVFSPDDKWAKCHLSLSQEVFQTPIPIFGSFAQLGHSSSRVTLLDEENQFRWKIAQMPGTIEVPRVDFSVFDPTVDVHAQLQIRFDIELEGESNMRFGSPPYQTTVVGLRTFQWTPTPA